MDLTRGALCALSSSVLILILALAPAPRAQGCRTIRMAPGAPGAVLPGGPGGQVAPGAGGLLGGSSGGLGTRPAQLDLADSWTILSSMPDTLGEVTSARIGNTIYVFGESDPDTVTLDLDTLQWSETLAADRPLEGNHQAGEVWNGKLYVIGGFKNGAQGTVQIYDPVSNSWSQGAAMPWNSGSVSTALIGGKIYVAGGIVRNSFTTDECGIYDPALDSWAPMASMPDGRNHAAAATDGRRLWVFGGRGPGSGDTNTVANGFADIQVYDPGTDSWVSSNDPGSPLQPLPIGRGGTGRAVFYEGEFYVFGGETLTGPGAVSGNVYDRVDVYCPVTHTWRQETPMPTARHGIYPVLVGRQIYVLGGGKTAGGSQSHVAEVLQLN